MLWAAESGFQIGPDRIAEGLLQPAIAYPIFAVWILLALHIYERFGYRLGGVLVLPFLLFYMVDDPKALLLFAVSAAAAYACGEYVHRRTLIYGRRLLVAFLLLSLVASGSFNILIGVAIEGVFMPLLPGLFAYNLHREGRPLWNAAIFGGSLLVVFAVTNVALGMVELLLA